MIRPLPENQGVGFFSMEPLPKRAADYREVNVGRFWNYHFTVDNYKWPDVLDAERGELTWSVEYVKDFKTIDGFSPNLNKTLRVHHLRNLALAASLCRIRPHLKPLALLGASQGVLSDAMPAYKAWCDTLDYHPEIYYDVLQPWDYVQHREASQDDGFLYAKQGKKDPIGCRMWDGPKGPVIVVRSNGQPNYVFYDIAFAKAVNPDFYLTGVEQKEHFEALGLENKHLPMGLVLGADGKKMKSRSGDSPSADEVMALVKEQLKETPDPDKLAWNVLAWNFLHTSRTQNVKFDAKEWTDPDAPGMYVTYTYARMMSALKSSPNRRGHDPKLAKHVKHTVFKKGRPVYPCKMAELSQWNKDNPDPHYDLTDQDLELVGTAAYHDYYHRRAVELMCPAQLANFAHTLARKLGVAYHSEKVKDGRYGFQYAVSEATWVLGLVMKQLGMFPLTKV